MPLSLSPSVSTRSHGRLVEPRALVASAGWDWIINAWQIFKSNIGLWLITAIFSFVIGFVLAMILFIGVFARVLNVFFMAGVAYMAHKMVNNNAYCPATIRIRIRIRIGIFGRYSTEDDYRLYRLSATFYPCLNA